MKRILALMLAAMMLLSLAACSEQNEEESGDRQTKYVYDDAGRVVKEEIYGVGTYYDENRHVQTKEGLLMEIEYSYNEKGQMTVKLWRDLLQVNPVTQREEFAYNDLGQVKEIKMYDNSNELFCTTAYTYFENGTIMSKEAVYTLKYVRQNSSDSSDLYQSVDYYFEPVRFQTGRFAVSVDKQDEPSKELGVSRRVDYYENGLEKTITTTYADTATRTEYPNNDSYQDTVVAWDEQFDRDCGKLYYISTGEGIYSTLGMAGVKEYGYDGNGELMWYTVYDEMGGAISEAYYPGGALKVRQEMHYQELYLNYYYPTKIEEFYESGARKSLKEADPQTGISTYTEWDEEGNVIATEEPRQ